MQPGQGLEHLSLNSPIFRIDAYDEAYGTCLATDSGGLGVLGRCPSYSGTGGSDGTIFVQNSAGYVVNRFWSNYNYSLGEYNAPSWMCNPGVRGRQVILYDDTGSAGTCQWNMVYA